MSTAGKLSGKVALVTGAGSGIGRAIAIKFAKDGATAVVVADRNVSQGQETVKLIQELANGAQALFVETDVSKVADTERMVQAAVSAFGQLNILVNSAGVMLEKNAIDTTEEDFDRVVGVNLKGAFFSAKHALIQFRKQGKGSGTIVNIASVNSFYGEGGIAAYCASKGGLGQLTRALAMDHGPDGIRVNAVCPGWIETPMNANFFAIGPHIKEQAARLHCLGKIGTPEEVANAVSFLASDEASFVTGERSLGGRLLRPPEAVR
eukprot:TRINITY_DN2595_c0_g1_i2.p2 TRINITY_DN2595_c0_g1~~TRINITY_DN2595_c0_g1_i2.p2  ORF type:complete len:264 (-),score=70.28 TRINITY_DN2595_c0_g1_i2:230-1021(-)